MADMFRIHNFATLSLFHPNKYKLAKMDVFLEEASYLCDSASVTEVRSTEYSDADYFIDYEFIVGNLEKYLRSRGTKCYRTHSITEWSAP